MFQESENVVIQDEDFNPPAGIENRFEDFLRLFETSKGNFFYLAKISEMIADGKDAILVDYNDLMRYDVRLAMDIRDDPEKSLQKINQGLVNVAHEHDQDIKFTDQKIVRFFNLPKSFQPRLRNIRSNDLNSLIEVNGTLIRMTNVRPFIMSATFECKACGAEHSIIQMDDEIEYPGLCNVGGCKNSKKSDFRLVGKNSDFVDWQQVRIQESPDEISAGNIPRHLDCILFKDLVDKCRPGDRVSVVGHLKIQPTTNNSKVATKGRVFQMLLIVNNILAKHDEEEDDEITQDDERIIKDLATKKNIDRILADSISPEIYGFDEVKMACALLLFSGVQKTTERGHRMRGTSNVLLVGDPSTGKSQILKKVARIAPRAVYVSGQGSSAAGLTASVIRDEISGAFALEAGALVLCDGGVACIDEFDKMRKHDQVAIHEALEQQTVSIAKAGIVSTLNARTTVLAAANPEAGRYDPDIPVTENIKISPTILSRFDLVFIIKDEPNEDIDEEIADHILKLHMPDEIEEEDSIGPKKDSIDLPLFKKYVQYANSVCQPEIKANSKVNEIIRDFYVKLRNPGTKVEDNPIPIVARSLEGIIRLSEARAKMFLRNDVIEEDAEEAIKLLLFCMKQVGYDYTTEKFDVDLKETGRAKSTRKKLLLMLDLIKKLQAESDGAPVPVNIIVERAAFPPLNVKEERVCLDLIRRLYKEEQIIEQKKEHYKVLK